MARIFVYDNTEYADPDPKMSVEEVRKQMADFIPELTNADTREEQRDGDTIYTFAKRIGTKGFHGETEREEVLGVLEAVSSLPPKRLLVMELAPSLFDERGDLKVEEAADRQPEINLAAVEVHAYARETQGLIEVLRSLPAR